MALSAARHHQAGFRMTACEGSGNHDAVGTAIDF
jgi:hypothetical protein